MSRIDNQVYYYCKDGKLIQIEIFLRGDNYGSYRMFGYYINKTGDTLTYIDGHTKEIFVLDSIPAEWNTYKADW